MKNTALAIKIAVLLLVPAAAFSQTWYQDSDGDGFGNISVSQVSGSQPLGYVKNNIDADDAISNQQFWGRLGKKGFTSITPSDNNIEICVGPSGTAYMVFLDPDLLRPTAMKKAPGDSTWSIIDIAGFTSRGSTPLGNNTHCGITVDSKDTVWAVVRRTGDFELWRWHSNVNNGEWLLRAAKVNTINVNGVLDVAIGANDTPFVVYRQGSDRPRCLKYNAGSNALEQAAPGAANDAVVNSAIRPEFMTVKTNSAGVPYVAYKRTNSSGQNDRQCVVYKRNASADGWDLIGNSKASEGTDANTRADSIKLAIKNDGNPVVFYSDYSNSRNGKGTVRHYNGSSWVTLGTGGFTAGAISMCDIAVDPLTDDIYIAYADKGDDDKVFVKKYNGAGGWASVFDSSLAPSGNSVSLYIRDGILYVMYKDNSNGALATAMIYGPSRIWQGNQSTNWDDARNWYGLDAPEAGDAVTFKASTSNEPSIPTGTTNFRGLQIQASDNLNIPGSSVFAVNGSLIVNGTVTGDGSIQLNSTLGSQSVSGTGTVNNLELNNSNGATIQSGSTISVTSTYTPTSGTLTTNGGLTLKSSASGTARIATGSGTYISGGATVERHIPGGRRAMRYFSHPFTTSLTLSQMTGTGEIDITGTGGASNGFTTTTTNAPSASWYDPTIGDESTISDPGWTYFTTTAGGGNNDWKQHQAIKVLVRGAKGQGLAGGTYTPSATTVTLTGAAINQGSQVVTLTKGTISGYNLIGNPFPSQVDLSQTVRGTNIEPNFYVWNPNGGTKGIYESNLFVIPFYLPAYGGFFARTANNTNNTITFPESCKVSNTPATLFKTTAGNKQYITELRITDSSNVFWDKFMLIIDSNTTTAKETTDAAKFFNSEMNFYSFSSNKDSLSIDARPYADSQVIKIDMWNGVRGKFIIDVAMLNMPDSTDLYLEDSFTHTTVKLTEGAKYPFTTTTDPKSEHNRFYLRFSGVPYIDTTTPPDTVKQPVTPIVPGFSAPTKPALNAHLYPNPAEGTNVINLAITNAHGGAAVYKVLNTIGQEMYRGEIKDLKNETLQIPVSRFPAGNYMVELEAGNKRIVKHFLKR